MRIDKNIIDAVKAHGDDRIAIAQHTGLIFCCKVSEAAKMGERGVMLQDASIVNGAKSIVFIGNMAINGAYIVMDLKDG